MSAMAQFRPEEKAGADAIVLAAAIEACPVSLAVVESSESSRIIHVNQAFARLFGYSQSYEIHGRRWAEYVIPETFEVAHRSGITSAEFGGKRRDGSRIPIKVSSRGFRVRDRDLLIVSVRDASLEKRSEQQLQESQKMEAVGRLLGGVAHDFNNLITGIMLYCDLLIAGLGRDHRLRHHAQEIRMAGQQSAALIQQLLAVARPQKVEAQVLSANEVVRSMQEFLARLIGEHIELVTALADGLGLVKIHPAQLQQILMNLVLNARDAMLDGGRVTVKTQNFPEFTAYSADQKSSAAWIEIAVSDTGCGMSAETRSHLFEPFFTTKLPGQGNELGLATVFGIVKQHGGTVVVESEPGRGTQVSVRLPRVGPKVEQEHISKGIHGSQSQKAELKTR
jgi:two-component system, cell cycle sensor histidine kinase and response regulator CckA